MVIRRAVKLAHIVCAIFSLGRPRGATSSQIYKFCSLKFNIRRDRRQFNQALQRAKDEDLVICFQRRYRLETTSKGGDILWYQKFRRYQGTSRQRNRSRAGAKLPRTRTCKPQLRATRAKFQRHKRAKFCSPCNIEERRLDVIKRRKGKKDNVRLRYTKKIGARGIILCKSFTCLCKRKLTPKRTVLRKFSRMRNKREVEMAQLTRKKKSNVRSIRNHREKRRCLKNIKPRQRKVKTSCSLKSKKTCEKRSLRGMYQEVLRGRSRTVAHAESWDRINHSLRRNERKNQELMKDCKMVKKILGARHGPSWDDLNKELHRIKSSRSFEVALCRRPSKKPKSRSCRQNM